MKTKLKLVMFMLLVFFAGIPCAFAESTDEADPLLSWTVGLPFKLLAAPLAGTAGLIVGGSAGFFRGAVRSSDYVAEVLGDKDGIWQRLAGVTFAAVPGGVVHSIGGGLMWSGKGAWIGLQRPLEYASVQSALEGAPTAIEETIDGASQVFSD